MIIAGALNARCAVSKSASLIKASRQIGKGKTTESRRRGPPHVQSTRRNSTKSYFSPAVSLVPRMRLKNSTVSSKLRKRPSCRYGGESLMPRIGNLTLAFSQNLVGLARGAMRWRTLFNGTAAFGDLLFM
jgi:hypothetical protein